MKNKETGEEIKLPFATYMKKFKEYPKNGVKVFGLVGGAGQETIEAFRHNVQAGFPIYEADDILLKTIVRSNPSSFLVSVEPNST